MTESLSPSRGATPSMVPMKRPLEDAHMPSVSSPLNPDAASRGRAPRPPTREQREKKDSLKKRESIGSTRGSTPDQPSKKLKEDDTLSRQPSPIRYNHALPREAFAYNVKEPLWAPHEPEPFFAPDGTELKRPAEHIENKKIYRYNLCVADPTFVHSRYYRNTDEKPYGPRMSLEDSDKWFHFDETATYISNEKGWRMGRANVFAREGRFYYEVKILRGVPAEGSPVSSDPTTNSSPLPHIRMGWARREAALDAPVGFDGYSYGLTDIRMDPMHRSRASKFLDDGTEKGAAAAAAALGNKKSSKSRSKSKQVGGAGVTGPFSAHDHAREGDVIGLEITLPSLNLHRKVVDGSYNPAVDVGSGLDAPDLSSVDEDGAVPNIVRDRFPVPYKGSMHFESMEYRSSKGMESYGDRGPFTKETPSPNHPDPTVRCLPHSSIRVWKNGRLVGTAFRNLMAFLPPASAPGVEKGVRQGQDDGMLGYFPAVSAFSTGVAQVNFGPEFWFPPPGLEKSALISDPKPLLGIGDEPTRQDGIDTEESPEIKKEEDAHMADVNGPDVASAAATQVTQVAQSAGRLRGVGERYDEQIAEDIVYDIVDEVDFFAQDGGDASKSTW